MEQKVKWGILSTARIGVQKVIPAMQKGKYTLVKAIASRDRQNAERHASELNIQKSYGTYEELLADPEIDAIYNPLPNHLHVSWTIKALEAGKHVLCEKPIGMNTQEAEELMEATKKFPELKVMEAFMYRFHPQWQKVRELVKNEAIGKVRTVQSFFSYYNLDPDNIRNRVEAGGGALMDIGCYCVSFPRFIFEEEPERVIGDMEFDPGMKIDRLTSGILRFPGGKTATFSCSTQLMPFQRALIFGDRGLIEVDIPVNAPPGKRTKVTLNTPEKTEVFSFGPTDQFTVQGDAFSKAILEYRPVPTPLDDATGNMKVIDGLRASLISGEWVNL